MKKLSSCVLLLAMLFVGACKSKDGANPFDPTTLVPTATVTTVPVQCLINYPVTATGSTNMNGLGLNIPSYPGTSLNQVVLYLSSSAPGTFGMTLSALSDCYDSGVTIGSTTQPATLSGSTTENQPVTFTFSGNPSVTKNNLVSFVLSGGYAAKLSSQVSPQSITLYFYLGTQADYQGATPVVNILTNRVTCPSVVSTPGFGIKLYGLP
jgi:hypothetical protein